MKLCSKTIEILNLFDISEIVVDSGKVSYSREGDKVTVTVSEGVYRVGRIHKMLL